MSFLKTPGEIRGQIAETNEAVNLLQKELGDYLNSIRKEKKPLPDYPYREFDKFCERWAAFNEKAGDPTNILPSGGEYDTAVEYLDEVHKWRARAVKDGALPSSKANDPYSVPPKLDGPTDWAKLALIGGGIYLGIEIVRAIRGK